MAREYLLFTQYCGDPAQLQTKFKYFENAEKDFETRWNLGENPFLLVRDPEAAYLDLTLRSPEDVAMHRLALERGAAWKQAMPTTIKTPVTRPNYYKEYVPTMEWLEAMQYIPSFRDPIAFIGGVEMLARKYLDRRGGKDPDLQEVMKALWYFKFMAAYMRAGRPIKISEVDDLLKDPL